MIRRIRNIPLRFTLLVLASTSVIFIIVISCFYFYSRNMLEKEALLNADRLVHISVRKVEDRLQSIKLVTEALALSLETGTYTRKSLPPFLEQTLKAHKEVHGLGAAFAPRAPLSPDRPAWPYFYRKGGRLVPDSEKDFKYVHEDWYQMAMELERPVWSQPYLSPNSGNTPVVSCSAPVFTGKGSQRRVHGAVVVDVSLDYLAHETSIQMFETGYSFLLSSSGTYLVHPNPDLVLRETIYSKTESMGGIDFKKVSEKMLGGESSFRTSMLGTGAPVRVYCKRVPSTEWILAVVLPENELYADLRSLTLTVIAIALFGIVFLTAVIYVVSRAVTVPLRILARAATQIAEGDFAVKLPGVKSHDEVGKLTLAFDAMVRDLKASIRDLTRTAAAEESLQSELRVAAYIQRRLLPQIFSPFPDRSELDIYASMDRTKEVGGDFYDFFLVDEHRLCFLIADVAGKGVPAALYAMVAKTLLKAEARRFGAPDRILAAVNGILSENNDGSKPLTVFCAILDTRTGQVTFANAGHPQPMLIRSGEVCDLPVDPGVVLGVMEEAVYPSKEIRLEAGDVLFLYTDGLLCAVGPDGSFYGEKRLMHILQKAAKEDLEAMNRMIRADIEHHTEGVPPFDDITLLAVKYCGQPEKDDEEDDGDLAGYI